MKAYARLDAMDQQVVEIQTTIPEPQENEVLIEVKSFGVGIHDRYFIPQEVSFPYIIGSEGAGMITKVGAMVKEFKKGDKVIFTCSLLPKGGCWARYVAVPDQNLIPMPDELDFTLAASLPIAGKTAMESIRALDLQKGNTLYIAGASGAIGTLVIQMAAGRGVRVAASASAKNHAYMQSLGAEKTVDYRDGKWKDEVKRWMPEGVDAALAIQPGTCADCLDVVKTGGKVITVSGDDCVSKRDILVKQFEHQLDVKQAVSVLAKEVIAGNIKVEIEGVYPFNKALEALEKTETRHARGKVVVSISEADA